MILVYIMLDLHLPEMRQFFKDACCFQHSEFIVVQAPNNRGIGSQRQRGVPRSQCRGLYKHKCDSQFCCVLRDVIGYFGEFLVGAVDCCALTATLLWARQVCETVAA